MSKLIESTKTMYDAKNNEKYIRVFFVDCDCFLDIPMHQFDAWEEDDFKDFIESRAA